MLQEFANELKGAREKSGLTLKQIAAKTRIDLKFLEAIETGDFMVLPELYVRAFIRQYAAMVELDEHQTLRKYELAKEGKSIYDAQPLPDEKSKTTPVQSTPKIKPHTYESEEKNVAKQSGQLVINRNYFFIAVGVLAVAFFTWFLFLKDSQTIIITERPYEEIVQETRQRYIEEEPETAAQFASDSLYLQINATDTAWINVEVDNNVKEEFLLYPRGKKELRAKEGFIVVIGNSGGVSLILNDRQLEFNGRRRTVSRIAIDKNGLRYLDSQTPMSR